MTPTDHGYVQCEFCRTWRPKSEMCTTDIATTHWCRNYAWCVSMMRDGSGGIPRGPILNEGWDANGAPTGLDEHGDAA